MRTMNRREFLKLGGAALLAGLVLPDLPLRAAPALDAPPASLGRIATWWRQAIRKDPNPTAEVVEFKRRDDVIPLYAALEGEAPWPTNSLWYQTEGGYIHSGYVQPVENQPQERVVQHVAAPGFWAEVCVPFAEVHWSPDSPSVVNKLYYGTVYRVVETVADEKGSWWYRLQEGITYAPGPYVPSWSLKNIAPEEVAPISSGRTDKWIQISIADQTLVCYEGEAAVFSTRIGSGLWDTPTPRGEFHVLYKRPTRRMIGGQGKDEYDLPGVAFPVYFTWSGVAIHGTYWHNDYGRRHSHGCVNVSNQAARWIFRWVDPVAPYDIETQKAEPDAGTRVVVI